MFKFRVTLLLSVALRGWTGRLTTITTPIKDLKDDKDLNDTNVLSLISLKSILVSLRSLSSLRSFIGVVIVVNHPVHSRRATESKSVTLHFTQSNFFSFAYFLESWYCLESLPVKRSTNKWIPLINIQSIFY